MLQGLSLSGLEDLAGGGESLRRSAILGALTNQYLELEPRLSDRHIDLYDNVFRVLVHGIELQARLALSEKLAPMQRAPRDTVRTLANDDYVAVASPVLRQSPVLEEADLLSVCANRSEGHRAAVAQRPGLTSTVTDALLEKEEQSVLVALIGNGSAKLSEAGAQCLADVASRNMLVAQALAARLQLPAVAVNQILEAAKAVVVSTLVAAEPEAKAHQITAAVQQAVDVVGSLPQEKSNEPLNDQQIVTLYVMKSFDEVEKALSRRTGIPSDLIGQALASGNIDAMLIVLKSARFAKPHAEGMISAKMGLPIGSRMLREPMDQLERINANDPSRMLRFVLQREQMRRAN